MKREDEEGGEESVGGEEAESDGEGAAAHLPLSVTEKTSRKPSPVLMYCSLMAPNSSCPAVSRTGHTHTHTEINTEQFLETIWFPHSSSRVVVGGGG